MENSIKKEGNVLLMLCICFLLFSSEASFSQSKTVIYNEDAQLQNVSYMELKSDHVVYQNPNIVVERNYRMFKKDLLLAIYPLGVYYVYDKRINDLVKVPYVSGENAGLDKIITKKNELLVGDVLSINRSKIKYKDYNSGQDKYLATEDAIVILHRNGDYNFYGEVPDVAETLLNVKDKLLSIAPEQTDDVVNVSETNEEDVNLNYSEDDVSLSVDKEEFKNKALSRTRELENYLHFIAGKQTDKFKANEAIESAVKLFLSENNIVQVSSKDKATGEAIIFKRKIREYLTRLKLLKYDKVRISWSDISYVSDIRMGTDGNYYGVIVIKQKFEGYIDGELKYTDVTTKKMTVILKTYDKYVAGEKKTLWDVFLGDIGVVDTV